MCEHCDKCKEIGKQFDLLGNYITATPSQREEYWRLFKVLLAEKTSSVGDEKDQAIVSQWINDLDNAIILDCMLNRNKATALLTFARLGYAAMMMAWEDQKRERAEMKKQAEMN